MGESDTAVGSEPPLRRPLGSNKQTEAIEGGEVEREGQHSDKDLLQECSRMEDPCFHTHGQQHGISTTAGEKGRDPEPGHTG